MRSVLVACVLLAASSAEPATGPEHGGRVKAAWDRVRDLVTRPWRTLSAWLDRDPSGPKETHRRPSTSAATSGGGVVRQASGASPFRARRFRLRLPQWVTRLWNRRRGSFADEPPPSVVPAEATGLLDFETMSPENPHADREPDVVLDVEPLRVPVPGR